MYCQWGVNATVPYRGCILILLQADGQWVGRLVGWSTIKVPRLWEVSLQKDKPLGSIYLFTDSHPIKVAATTPSNNAKAHEIAIETVKTGKVTAVVTVMCIFIIKKMQFAERYFQKRDAFRPKAGKCQFP